MCNCIRYLKLVQGYTRNVFQTKNYAIKIPRVVEWRIFLCGLLLSTLFGCSVIDTTPVSVLIIGHVPFQESGSGPSYDAKYEYWILEETNTKIRRTIRSKLGEVGDTFMIPKNKLN